MIHLRDYQSDLIQRTRDAMRQHRNVLMQAPTGAGKTALTVHMMATAASRGKTCMFLVHQSELLKQTSAALWVQRLEHGVIAPGKRRSKLPVQVASVQTLVRRLDQYDDPDLIVIDEAHRAAAATYAKVLEAYPSSRVVGLTATPARTDGKPLGDMFDAIVEGPSIRSLIDSGYLADYVLAGPPGQVSTEGIKTQMGDFNKKELEDAVDKPTITGDAVAHYQRMASGKRCVVMCVTVKHAEHVAEQYRGNGVPAACIEGSMSGPERQRVLDDFRAGRVLVLCNVALMVEGVDLPSIEVVQWLRPTQSMIIWMQGNGRGLRPAPGKRRLLILDHVGNWQRHGIPDEDREWSLAGRQKAQRGPRDEDELDIQQCQECYAVFRKGPDACPSCGEPLPGNARQEIEHVDGDLEEVDVEQIRRDRRREQGQARTLRELVALGLRRGIKKPAGWAAYTAAARAGRKPTGAEFKAANEVLRELQSGRHGDEYKEAF